MSQKSNALVPTINPKDDGLKHINVWSKAKTELGQLLSNFAQMPFRHPTHGFFASMEGYWFWCSTGRSQDHLRRLFAVSARNAGQKCEQVPLPEEEFRDMIREGLSCKIYQNRSVRELLKDSRLPLKHYFVYGKDCDVVVDKTDKHGWQMEWLELLRKHLQGRVVTQQNETVIFPDTMIKLHDGQWRRASEIQPNDALFDPTEPNCVSPLDLVELADGTWVAAGDVPAGAELRTNDQGRIITDQVEVKPDRQDDDEIRPEDIPF